MSLEARYGHQAGRLCDKFPGQDGGMYALYLLLLVAAFFSPSMSADTISQAAHIEGNQTLVSAGGVFQLGFFSPAGTDGARRYLGIWYYNIPGPTVVVWVANRVRPLLNSPGVLKISADGRLLVLDGQNDIIVWSSATPTREVTAGVTARLLDDGNFVLSSDGSGSEQSVAWQSFDYPTDTLLPGMKLGVDIRAGISRRITSWSRPTNPYPGAYTFELLYPDGGLPQFSLLQDVGRMYSSGPWNDQIATATPFLKSNDDFTFKVVTSPDEKYYSFTVRDPTVMSRIVVASDDVEGKLKHFTFHNGTWSNVWNYPTDRCDGYAVCGAFGYCDPERSPVCSCLPGFAGRSQEWNPDMPGGCLRRTTLRCGAGDGFWVVNRMKLPDAMEASVYAGMTLGQCRETCLNNCSCTAYAAANVSGGTSRGCVIWTTDLVNMRQYPTVVQDVYIRLAQSEIDALKAAANRLRRNKIAVVVTTPGVFLLVAVGCCCFWRKKLRRKGERKIGSLVPMSEGDVPCRLRKHPALSKVRDQRLDEDWECADQDVDLPLFDMEVILVATDNFAAHNKIGEGGFGPVYMGKLEDGQQVAVKRLRLGSMQGVGEFMNEVKLIAKLQHRNLVRLLGCCIDDDERILVYEYLHNQSLDTFIFDEGKRMLLTWQKRFEIIMAIARGLLYLHEDSRFRIIHRDLKASNVLLDRNMIPKISDFGIARIFGGEQTIAYTRKVIGTYGYMSPEYAMDGIISMKSDVFSFGVLVLEILTGRRNQGSYNPEHDLNLLGYTWMLWKEGRSVDLLDEVMDGRFDRLKALKCIQVALLCVEAQPRNRPLMSSVVMMMASENAVVPEPKEPGINIGKNMSDTESMQSVSANYVTVTAIEAR